MYYCSCSVLHVNPCSVCLGNTCVPFGNCLPEWLSVYAFTGNFNRVVIAHSKDAGYGNRVPFKVIGKANKGASVERVEAIIARAEEVYTGMEGW